MNIICIYWQGDFRGRDFSMTDVEKLYNSVREHTEKPFRFYCLTNVDDPFSDYVFPIKLIHDFPGWWTKVELHRPDLPPGRTLYLDLDTHIVGDLDLILDYPGDLVMFNTRVKGIKQNGLVPRYQAATMLFDSGTSIMTNFYKRFCETPDWWMLKYRSEQDVMGDWIPDQPTFPNEWLLKLNDCKRMLELPKSCILVTGQPKDISFRDWKIPQTV